MNNYLLTRLSITIRMVDVLTSKIKEEEAANPGKKGKVFQMYDWSE